MADSMSTAWHGLSAFYSALEDKQKAMDRGAKTIVVKGSAMLVSRSKALFTGSHKPGTPTLAAPGGPPSIITGYLRRSIISTPMLKFGPAHYATTVGPTAVYGRAVELGLRNGAAYPYFTPAAQDVSHELEALSQEIWAELLR